MSKDESRGELFLQHLPEDARARIGSLERLERLLARIADEVRRAWPEVALPAEVFLPFLAERVSPQDRSVERELDDLKVEDLYLACACLRGDPAAVSVFRTYLSTARAAVARMESSTALVDDIEQMLHQRLLIGDREHQPRLLSYSGRGDLRSWLRVTAVRTALDLLRSDRRRGRELDEDALLDLGAPDESQELQYLKRLYRREFKAAFQRALARLSSRDRNILRLQLIDGLNIDQVGSIYNVHRATVARWNAKLRDRLLAETRRGLLDRLKIDRGEFESIMRLIQSHFDVSICRHLDED